jgi:endonuclease-3
MSKINLNNNKILKIIKVLALIYPDTKTDLTHSSPFELLISTMLSAQCTDKRVNIVTPNLFSKYPDPISFALANQSDVENIIMSTGFYKNKTKNIIATSKMLVDKFNSRVPSTIDKLTLLPGVGRKTANCVLGAYFEPQGIVVDTHVIRITNLLGIVNTKNAEQIEMQLIDITPKKHWVKLTHLFIRHGRNTCIARRPKCSECQINKYCDTYTQQQLKA